VIRDHSHLRGLAESAGPSGTVLLTARELMEFLDRLSEFKDDKKQSEQQRTLAELATAYRNERDWKRADELCDQLADKLPPAHFEQLKQLASKGPVEDGDVISKNNRGDLIRWGLAERCLVRGQWGYTACTYLGGHVLNAIERRRDLS
jgi:hypothetical protein